MGYRPIYLTPSHVGQTIARPIPKSSIILLEWMSWHVLSDSCNEIWSTSHSCNTIQHTSGRISRSDMNSQRRSHWQTALVAKRHRLVVFDENVLARRYTIIPNRTESCPVDALDQRRKNRDFIVKRRQQITRRHVGHFSSSILGSKEILIQFDRRVFSTPSQKVSERKVAMLAAYSYGTSHCRIVRARRKNIVARDRSRRWYAKHNRGRKIRGKSRSPHQQLRESPKVIISPVFVSFSQIICSLSLG
jgi:hypothetical protein